MAPVSWPGPRRDNETPKFLVMLCSSPDGVRDQRRLLHEVARQRGWSRPWVPSPSGSEALISAPQGLQFDRCLAGSRYGRQEQAGKARIGGSPCAGEGEGRFVHHSLPLSNLRVILKTVCHIDTAAAGGAVGGQDQGWRCPTAFKAGRITWGSGQTVKQSMQSPPRIARRPAAGLRGGRLRPQKAPSGTGDRTSHGWLRRRRSEDAGDHEKPAAHAEDQPPTQQAATPLTHSRPGWPSACSRPARRQATTAGIASGTRVFDAGAGGGSAARR